MKGTTIIMKKDIKLKNPILIVGLPGIGNVGRIVAEHIKKEFKAEKIATLYSPYFPYQVAMTKNGGVKMINNKFYLVKPKGTNTEIVLLTGDFQALPEGQYELNEKIVKFFMNRLNGKFIYTIGGYLSNEKLADSPRVFGNATSLKTAAKFKKTKVIFGKTKGYILGSAGLIIGFAKLYGLEGICIMGETSIVGFDALAAKAVLEALSEILHIKIDTEGLDKIAKETNLALEEAERQMAVGGLPGEIMPDTSKPSYIR